MREKEREREIEREREREREMVNKHIALIMMVCVRLLFNTTCTY